MTEFQPSPSSLSAESLPRPGLELSLDTGSRQVMQQISPLSTPGSDIPSLHSSENTPLTPQEAGNSQHLLGSMSTVENSMPRPITGGPGIVEGNRRWPPLDAGYLNWISHDGPLLAQFAHEVSNTGPATMFGSPGEGFDPASMPPGMDTLITGTDVFGDLHGHLLHSPSDDIEIDRRGSRHHRLSLDTGSIETRPGSPSTGQYYVDGDDCGRLPRIRKRKHPDRIISSDELKDVSLLSRSDSGNILGFCPPETYSQSTSTSRAGVPLGTYADIVTAFKELCCNPSFFYPAFESSHFLPYEVVDSAVSLFFEEFNTILPLVHAPTLKLAQAHWLLVLAMASVGMHSMNLENQDRNLVAVHEFARRAVFASVSNTFRNYYEMLTLTKLCCSRRVRHIL